MIQVDDLLERLRVQVSRYSLIDSLLVIHAYVQYLQFDQEMPGWIEVNSEIASRSGYDRKYYEWDLDLLSRQLLQDAPPHGLFSLSKWEEFAACINLLRKLDDDIAVRVGEALEENVLLELGRIAYRTFPWQEHPNHWRLIRYFKIFSDPAVDAIVSAQTGLSAREIYLIGFALIGRFRTRFEYQCPIDLTIIGISDQKRRLFMQRFSKPLSELITMARDSEWRDENFLYSQNPLRIFPIAQVGNGGKNYAVAPIPSYLFHRITAGLYYELIGHRDFGHAFGHSFQNYIGEVLSAALPVTRFAVLGERQYHVGRDRKDSIDWIASDETSHLFVECKTKRMQLSSRTALLDRASLNEDIAKISDFVVQTYKSMADASAGLYEHWTPDHRPIYPVIVLLEEWYMFDFRLQKQMDDLITSRLTSAGIDVSVLTTSPYSICSCAEFEILSQVVAKTSIGEVLEKKHADEKTKWNMKSFLLSEFGKETTEIGRESLFPDVLDSIHPVIETPKDLETQ